MGNADERANARLRELWATERASSPGDLHRLWPLQYPELRGGRVVFVGFNPSHVESSAPILELVDSGELADSTRVAKIIALERAALGRDGMKAVPYYRPLNEFFPENQPAWEHIDVFAVRHATQKTVVQHLQAEGKWTPFAEAQVEIFTDLLNDLKPSLVVVINAAAASLIRARIALLNFQADLGYHTATIGSRDTPFFFSGMLTGKRALDVHSRERLIWHVRAALQERKEETP